MACSCVDANRCQCASAHPDSTDELAAPRRATSEKFSDSRHPECPASKSAKAGATSSGVVYANLPQAFLQKTAGCMFLHLDT